MNEELTTPQAEVSMPERISNYLSAETPKEDEAPPEAQSEDETPVEESASELPTDEPESDPPEEEELEITWNGEAKRLKKSEALDLAQKGFDYTQKTQQLADARKRFEADVQALQQSSAIQNALQDQIAEVKALDRQLDAYKGVNWQELAESDPMQYLKLNQSYRDLKEVRESKVQEVQGIGQQFQQSQAQHMSQVLERESQLLASKLPEFSGEKKAENITALRSYLVSSGFSEAEVAGVVDHRAVSMAWKAMQYDKLKSAKPAIEKKVQNLPKPVKPGTSPERGQIQAEQRQKQRAQLRKTGKIPPGLLARFI